MDFLLFVFLLALVILVCFLVLCICVFVGANLIKWIKEGCPQ